MNTAASSPGHSGPAEIQGGTGGRDLLRPVGLCLGAGPGMQGLSLSGLRGSRTLLHLPSLLTALPALPSPFMAGHLVVRVFLLKAIASLPLSPSPAASPSTLLCNCSSSLWPLFMTRCRAKETGLIYLAENIKGLFCSIANQMHYVLR